MRFAIDCRALRKSPSGIPNFLVTAINEMAVQEHAWQFYLLTNEPFNAELQANLSHLQNVHTLIKPLPTFNKIALLWYIFKAGSIVKDLKADLFWAPSFLLPPFLPRQIKRLITVHDMVYKLYPETMSFTNKLSFKLLNNYSVRTADMIWTNSNYTQEQLLAFFPTCKAKRLFSGFFINTDIFKPLNISREENLLLKQQYHITDKTILFVGTLEPRKNLSFLLSLMPELSKKGYRLLIIGAKGWGSENPESVLEQQALLKDNVQFAGFVPTESLVKIYNLVTLYISTSKNDGFGMPQLEAMACGCPVISPHNSAMIEVVKGAGETVQGWEKSVWIKTIDKVFNNRQNYADSGLLRVQRYSKQAVIANLISFIKKAI